MKIALTADPELPVPPILYGGIERIIDMLAKGLAKRGHNVTLFAHSESNSAGRLIQWPGKNSQSKFDTIKNAATLWKYANSDAFDVIHSFSRIAYLTPILSSKTPKLMSYQREISTRTTQLAHRLAGKTLEFSAISDWMIEPVKHIGSWTVIPNGVDIETYDFVPEVAPDAPLVFLGRIEEIKGPHLAIEIARRTGHPLIIAGNIPPDKQEWAEANVLAHVDGKLISYIGPVNDSSKNQLLGKARAFLMPILWEEPFGIVMAEALACGTPVIGLNRGAVPEVVIDGVTGFVRNSLDELVASVAEIDHISRAACRVDVEARFSADGIVGAYEELYQNLIARART